MRLAVVARIGCPKCGAAAGEQCIGASGQERMAAHRARWSAAGPGGGSPRRRHGNPETEWGSALARKVIRKARIGRAMSRAVMERDAYRCVACGTHLNLTCDHIIPESKGGPTTLDNLQTMCQPCNSRKGSRL